MEGQGGYYSAHPQAAFPNNTGFDQPQVWTPPPVSAQSTQQQQSAYPTINPTYDAASLSWASATTPSPPPVDANPLRNRQAPSTSPPVRPHQSNPSAVMDASNGVNYLPSTILSNPLAAAAFNAYGAQVTKQMSGLFTFLNLHRLKYYFHVNNRYVINKLYVLLMPFMHKNWKRERIDGIDGDGGAPPQYGQPPVVPMFHGSIYRPPSEDINSPDLYIPSMAFFTYIILVSYTVAATHTDKAFDPELIGVLTSSTLLILLFELLLVKLGLWLINTDASTVPHLLDLVSYLSYKYVHAILILSLFNLTDSGLIYYLSILLMGSLQALFMMRTMNRALKPVVDHSLGGSVGGGGGMKGNYLLLLLGALQIFVIGLLVKSVA